MTASAFLAARWAAPASIVAGTTLRHPGFSNGPYAALNMGMHVADQAEAVTRNRTIVQSTHQLPGQPYWLRQVHGRNVVRAPFSELEPEADGCVTREGNVVCSVLTADCLPVLFCSADGREVGAAHAGWRGLHAGVLEATVAQFDCGPKRLLAWFGPAISQLSFEVGAEVRDLFLARDAGVEGHFQRNENARWQADLYGLARRRLQQIGVAEIFGGDRCTYVEDDRFFSYRRDGQCGRMASFIFRRDE